MLNLKSKKEALEELKRTSKTYVKEGERAQANSVKLLNSRQLSSRLIKEVESYINTIANTPKEYESKFAEVKIYLEKFKAILDIKYDEKKANQVTGSIAGTGVAVGAGVAAFAPSAAIAIATTFGTASTGTAISALSGAAATNAALAWLGGGVVAGGGGGMLAGNALLALAGPIGWTIGGTALVGSALYANKKNKDVSVKAQKETIEFQKKVAVLVAANIEIVELQKLTKTHREGLMNQLCILKEHAPKDFKQFTPEQKFEIGCLVNNTLSLSKLINKKVGK